MRNRLFRVGIPLQGEVKDIDNLNYRNSKEYTRDLKYRHFTTDKSNKHVKSKLTLILGSVTQTKMH